MITNQTGVYVHFDMKPKNGEFIARIAVVPFRGLTQILVFLCWEDINNYKMYPVPKLGDFGLCEDILPNEPGNPNLFWGIGTDDFKAPVSFNTEHTESCD